MPAKGDMTITSATESPDGTITAVFRITDTVSNGKETSGTEHICTATPDELTAAMVDTSDAAAVVAYLGRDLLPKTQPITRGDLTAVSVSVSAIATKETAREQAIDTDRRQ